MVKQSRTWTLLALGVLSLAACGDEDEQGDKRPKPVTGTYVGKTASGEAFAAVVAAPPGARGRRDVNVYLCDGESVCESMSGAADGNKYRVRSRDRDATATGELSGKAATGTAEVRGDKPVRYRVTQAPAAAGLYTLTVSSRGALEGASASGVALTGESTLPRPGNGTLKLADGKRYRFQVTRSSGGSSAGLRAGQMRLIVLPDGQFKGAARAPDAEGAGSTFYVRSTK